MGEKVHLREAARQLGVAPATALRWIERLGLKTVTLPDGRKYLRAQDVLKIKAAREGNPYAMGTSAGMNRWHDERRKTKESA